MKKCCRCFKLKPITKYTKRSGAKDGLSYRCKECDLESRIKRQKYIKNYTKTNSKKLREYDKQYKSIPKNLDRQAELKRIKRKNNPEVKLREYTRNRINECVKLYQYKKLDNTLEALGCSISQYIIYLESQFNNNMGWDNYGTYWEVDHIIPLSKGGSFHYTNTQPLTIPKNRSKGNNLELTI
jgi:5-methylcytosine-specific restriction endonuclease McrA